MKYSTKKRELSILALLFALIVGPSLLQGWREALLAGQLAPGKPDQAAALYESAARRLFWRADLLQSAGASALAGGDPIAALRLLKETDARHALSAEGRLALGDAYYQLGNIPAAVQAWEQLRAAAGTAPLFNRLGRAYTIQQRYDEAITAFSRAVALDPEDVYSRYWLGLLLATRRPQEALTPLIEAAQIDPQLDPVIQVLRKGLNTALLETEPAAQLTGAGRTLLSIGELTLAEEAMRQAQQADPAYAPAYAWMGAIRQQQGTDSLPDLQAALALDPRLVDAWLLTGSYWLGRGDADKALSAFEQATLIEPQNPAWQVTLGDARARTGDFEGALASFNRAVTLAPQNADYWRMLANFSIDYNYALSDMGIPAALKAQALAPADQQNMITLGRAYFASGDLETAGQLWQKVFEKEPDDPAINLYLGMWHLQKGSYGNAYDLLTRVLTLDPGGKYAAQSQRMLDLYFK